METKQALLNQVTGVIFPWTPELAKRSDLVPVTVDSNFRIVKDRHVEIDPVKDEVKPEPIKEEDTGKAKRGKKKG